MDYSSNYNEFETKAYPPQREKYIKTQIRLLTIYFISSLSTCTNRLDLPCVCIFLDWGSASERKKRKTIETKKSKKKIKKNIKQRIAK